jgi:hypothetical protein
MMLAKTGCMQSHNLEVGMNNSNMNDFITSKERLGNPWKFKFIDYELLELILILFVIGSLHS